MTDAWRQFTTTITAQQRRDMYNQAQDEQLARPVLPRCVRCLGEINSGSKVLHNLCAERWRDLRYLARYEQDALDRYDAEQQARQEVTADAAS
jgi:hypothetical protein